MSKRNLCTNDRTCNRRCDYLELKVGLSLMFDAAKKQKLTFFIVLQGFRVAP